MTNERKTGANSVFNQLAVSHLPTETCFKDIFSLIDRFVHQNRQLIKYAKRCVLVKVQSSILVVIKTLKEIYINY